ncbi:MAG TPA: O-antigen polysaccharide polymerase Wzy [Aggregatilineaceae bacterium]|nr:O-antigen polysaccharide polymerase Wzy [Aggregatilineaceae bacterium]
MHSITLEQHRLIPAPAVTGTISGRKTLLTLHASLFTLVMSAGLLYPVLQLDGQTMMYPACALVTISLVWILWSWHFVRGTLFEPYPLFMLSAGLFNGGQALLEVFGLNTEGILNGHVSPEVVTSAVYLVALSLLALHTGALLALKNPGSRATRCCDTMERRRATRLAGWLLLGAAAVPTFTLLSSSLSVVFDYGYLGLYRYQNTMSTAQAMSAFFVPGVIFLLAGSKQHRWLQGVSVILAAAYAVIYLFLGARGSAAMGCIAVAWVFDRSIRKIPRSLIFGLAVVALMVFSLVRETRGASGRDRLSLSDQFEALSNMENPISSSISEMGNSLVTVTHTLQLVPATREFDYGVSYLYAALAVVPNIGWEVHPSIAHGLLSDWLIRTVDPVVASAGGGLGFSFIAEAYLNFGWFGGPFFLALIGYTVCWIFSKADGDDPANHALTASFLSFFFVFSRGESAIVARGLVWYAILPYLLAAVLTIRRRKGVAQ